MNVLELFPKFEINEFFDLRNLSKINDLNFTKNEISKISFFYKNKKISLLSVFDFKLKENSKLTRKIIINNTNENFHYAGFKWAKDNLEINGNVGSFVGFQMKSGSIDLNGSATTFLGCQMIDGEIHVNGQTAGDYVGAANFGDKMGMNGGLIRIFKDAGSYLGQFMRRGTIIVEGNIGDLGGNNMIAGTIFIFGNIGKSFCTGMKRGTVILNKKFTPIDDSFVNCGRQEINFFPILKKLLNKKIKTKNNLKVFNKFIGDRKNNGLGEILFFNIKNHN